MKSKYRALILSTAALTALTFVGAGVMSGKLHAAEKTTTTTTTTLPAPDAQGISREMTVIDQTTTTVQTPVTVTKTTETTPKMIAGTIPVDFTSMDLNSDGILSRREVGEKLFFLFDTDGNRVIDNIEIKKNQVITLVPFERKHLTMIDFNDDGIADVVDVEYQDFTHASMLNRFDKDSDGLSAEEFIGHSALELDTDKSGVVEYPEWKEAYAKSVSPLSAKQWRYQQ